MSIFIFTVMFGFMTIVSGYLGLTTQFIIIVVLGIVAQFIQQNVNLEKIDINNIKEQDNIIKEGFKKIQEERQKQLDELTKKAENYDFFGKHQIPVRVNKDTNTYVIDVDDLVNAIDRFYCETENSDSDERRTNGRD